jgi:nicotinamide mononucleotide (NMN) deamidase PncC
VVLLVVVAVAVVVGPMGTLRSVSTFGLVYATLAVAVAVVVGPMGTLRSVSTFGLVYATLATAVS